MKLLDLFCCAGGASTGYAKAGFEIVGVDIKNQPNYPFQFIKADVMDIIKDQAMLDLFDAFHASPPCQGYSHATKKDSKYVHYSQGKDTPKLISSVREILIKTGKPYVIENVSGAKSELINPIYLTGYMFGLNIMRKRFFESNVKIPQPINPTEKISAKKYAIQNNIDYRSMSVTGKSRNKGCIDLWKSLMEMPWAGRGWELAEAIPPAYTRYIGQFLIQHIRDNE